jgi:threonine/homoserine/homoserine lactone efflux protein
MALNFLLRVGPIGVLCIRRSLAGGRLVGFVTGLGAASADALYGCLAGLGVSSISALFLRQRFSLSLIGGAFLCYLGIRTFLTPPRENDIDAKSGGLAAAYASSFVLTLTNPMTILSFTAIFAGLGLGQMPGLLNATNLVAGVFLGSALWWLLLSGSVAWFGSRMNPSSMQVINRISGIVILAFGIYALVSALVR